MSKRITIIETVKDIIGKDYPLEKVDIGEDALLSKNGMTFATECFEAKGLGRVCVMTMKAMLGLMKMETVIIAADAKDVPLFNLDYVSAFGKETQIAELYDTMLSPLSDARAAEYAVVKEKYADIEEKVSAGHWYDEILYPFSTHKAGKKLGDRLADLSKDYIAVYEKQLKDAADCDKSEKAAKTAEFANKLYESGGPAVDQVKKLFGDETARRLVVNRMYGVK